MMAEKDSKTIMDFSKSHSTEHPAMRYISENSLRLAPAQEKLIKFTKELPMARMLSSSDQMQLLGNLVRTIKGERTLDVGVFTGYSALSMALALPDHGKVIAMDVSEKWANMGKPFWKEAGVYNKIDLRIGPAVDTLEKLVGEGQSGSFDFAYIDADKTNYSRYYELCMQLIRPGGIIAVDNMLWSGKVFNPEVNDEDTVAIRDLTQIMKDDQRIDFTLLPVADGVALAFKHWP